MKIFIRIIDCSRPCADAEHHRTLKSAHSSNHPLPIWAVKRSRERGEKDPNRASEREILRILINIRRRGSTTRRAVRSFIRALGKHHRVRRLR